MMAILELFVLLGGILLAQTFVLAAKFSSLAKGYLWPAARWIWSFLFVVFVVEWVIAMVVFFASADRVPCPRLPWAAFVGIIITLAPNAVEFLLVLNAPKEEKLRSSVAKSLDRLNIFVIRAFADSIKTLSEQDNLDLQRGCHPALPGLAGEQIGRRIRKLYAWRILSIATDRRDPSLLRRDVGYTPWDDFYILMPRIGRKAFLDEIRKDPPSPPPLENWNGSERRRVLGTKAQRSSSEPTDPTLPYCRIYDNDDIMNQILRGDHWLIEVGEDSKAPKDSPSV